MREEILNLINEPYFYPYVGNHVFFPMLLCLLSKQNRTNWEVVFLVFSLVSVWEIVEVLAYFVFESFVIFGTDNSTPETVGDVVFLDMGNGVLGIILGLLTLECFPPKYYNSINKYAKWSLFLLFGGLYSHFCSYNYCKTNKCEPPYDYPWNSILNGTLLIFYTYGWISTYYTDSRPAFFFTINGLILIGAVSLRWKSTAITVYIATFSMIGVYSLVYLYQIIRKTRRTERTTFTQLKTTEESSSV